MQQERRACAGKEEALQTAEARAREARQQVLSLQALEQQRQAERERERQRDKDLQAQLAQEAHRWHALLAHENQILVRKCAQRRRKRAGRR